MPDNVTAMKAAKGRSKTPAVDAKVEHITPTMAKQWLDLNNHNRRLSTQVADRYARDIDHDEFPLTGETIKFDFQGNLMDGQHRLEGVVRSGKAIDSVVVRGLHPDVFAYIDRGKKRTHGDTLTLMGFANAASLGSAAGLLKKYYDGDFNRLHTKQVVPSNREIMDMVEQHPGLQYAVAKANTKGMRRLGQPSILAVVFYVLNQIDPEDAAAFFAALETGTGVTADSPIILLRDYLIDARIHRVRLSNSEVAAKIFLSWNAWRTRRPLRNLSWNQKDFPQPI